MRRRGYLRAVGVAGVATAGCVGSTDRAAKRANEEATKRGTQTTNGTSGLDATLTLATATTAYDTGLLDTLHTAFTERFGIQVKTLSQGTGAALRTARDGDADVVIAHARPAEDQFIRDGHGVNRRALMHNDFLIVGPPDDPAAVADIDDPVAAFEAIATSEALFLSRGDDSGTHRREQKLWSRADASPEGRWYQAAGDGMGDTLRQASRRGAYTLVDRGTFRVFAADIDLNALVEGPLGGGPNSLLNEYGVIPTNPARHDVAYELAMLYVGFLTGRDGQAVIREFRTDGERVFVPDTLSADPQFDQYVPATDETETDE
ncbi:ABC tungstate transporter, permease component [Halogeometricum borinquense DSM 11551]|uniref:ABC tungstate transporter, permease component n=2 Tax=Halogeometricum borinquense TaxID=60847 RepID=E4NNN4_HALBP|nr:substrate-binding domain-containing protein [Halogeometricum borinquense]ADQ67498.1 ABC-type tungstate transport system, permease component [Halogeometricum borinquense DSM 11551]ELY23820.1 ABC tungstate transporter, permease component [Halogeometricum borinquense DSM 11551]RYJ13527.1 molybdenum transporter [Halogeometricum borinquense]